MTKNEYTVAVKVHEDYLDTEKDIHYSTVVIVEAEDMEEVEEKVLDWFDKNNIEGFVIHKVEIIKVLPKIH